MVDIARPEMSERISQLVHSSFNVFVADGWEPSARRNFLDETSASAIAGYLANPAFAAVEIQASEIVGFILMPRPSVVSLLFVHPSELRKGVGRRLWEAARAHLEATHSEIKTVELNSTPCALDAYKALGFVPISAEFVHAGCRATRMACWLPARGLGADAL
jgi:GNAT superfamily N-acetyltransferase